MASTNNNIVGLSSSSAAQSSSSLQQARQQSPPSAPGNGGGSSNGGSLNTNVAGTVATMTITETQNNTNQEAVLPLTLRARPSVTWDEDVVDNEGLGRKSSKRCCIFHKQRAFGESSTDSSDYDSDRSGSSTASGASDPDGDGDKKVKPSSRRGRRIARSKKNKKKVPDYQRYHA